MAVSPVSIVRFEVPTGVLIYLYILQHVSYSTADMASFLRRIYVLQGQVTSRCRPTLLLISAAENTLFYVSH